MNNKIISQLTKSLFKDMTAKLNYGKTHPVFVFLLLIFLAAEAYSAPQAGGVDPNFNLQIQTNSYSVKNVFSMVTLPDDKMVVAGSFNSFNRQPVGKIIRLTADGLLDVTFNSDALTTDSEPLSLYLQPDGKILVYGNNLKRNGSTAPLPRLIRLNADGTFDQTFNFFDSRSNSGLQSLAVYDDGRIIMSGDFRLPVNGNSVYKFFIRINSDGSYDDSFNFTSDYSISQIVMQNNKPIATAYNYAAGQEIVFRLNESGSFDSSFAITVLENFTIISAKITTDRKIVIMSSYRIRCLNENGGFDSNFQTVTISSGRALYPGNDGTIIYSGVNDAGTNTTISKLLANGSPDPDFTTFIPVNYTTFTIQSDNEIFVGDSSAAGGALNNYVHLFATGQLDSAFNPGGLGFQTINSGSIGAIVVQPDQKIVVAGKFDLINELNRSKIARLNTDNTIDNNFQINTGATGNRFTDVSEIYNLALQSDGKIIVSGSFSYTLNGVNKSNVVRLNTDGSIDSTFNLGAIIQDLYPVFFGGKNRTAIQSNGKILVAASRFPNGSELSPTRFNSDGSKDSNFNPTFL